MITHAVGEQQAVIDQSTAYEQLTEWPTDELDAYLGELQSERRALWSEPVPDRSRLHVVEQRIGAVQDVLWLRTIAEWRAEDAA